jgi:hypothetical protein
VTGWRTPPQLARRLLYHALPTDVRESVVDDLDELFQRDCRDYGPLVARRRYWQQSVSFTAYFGWSPPMC